MKSGFFYSFFGRFYTFMVITSVITQGASTSFAQQTPTHEALNQKNTRVEKVFNQKIAEEEQNTHLLLDSREKNSNTAAHSPFGLDTNLTVGKERAKAMVQIIQDVEMKKALEKVTAQSNKVLDRNPEVRTPIMILAGMAAAWFGRGVGIIKDSDVQVSTHVEGRTRSGGFNIASPILNGQLKYSQSEGAQVGVNRSISSFNTSALLNYDVNNQAVSTQLNQRLAPNLNLSVGAGQNNGTTEGSAAINYELHF